MRKILSATLLALFVAAPAFAANAQQDKMKACSAQAGEKKLAGDERKKFMAECLKAAPAKAEPAKVEPAKAAPAKVEAKADPKQAMKDCMAAAKGKKGDEFKKFRTDCLKAGGPSKMK